VVREWPGQSDRAALSCVTTAGHSNTFFSRLNFDYRLAEQSVPSDNIGFRFDSELFQHLPSGLIIRILRDQFSAEGFCQN